MAVEDHEIANRAFDLNRVLRQRLYLDRGGDPQAGGVITDPILQTSADPLPEFEAIEEERDA